MTLKRFKNEAQFREEFVVPLLRRLGFVLVTHSHGSDEQGKDFYFADFDRFENMRFYAAQAKLGNIGAGTAELDGLLNQVRRAFRVRIRNRRDAEDKRVSAVYVLTTGTISERAREYISDHCRSEPFGENVFFMDGDRLTQIDKHGRIRDDNDLRSRLVGLLQEGRSNLQAFQVIESDFTKPGNLIPIRCRISAIEAYLINPLPQSLLNDALVDQVWIALDELNRVCEMWSNAITFGRGIGDNFKNSSLLTLSRSREAQMRLLLSTEGAIRAIDERYSAEVDVQAN